MRNINVTFDDEEIELLEVAKGSTSWHDFILTLVKTKGDIK